MPVGVRVGRTTPRDVMNACSTLILAFNYIRQDPLQKYMSQKHFETLTSLNALFISGIGQNIGSVAVLVEQRSKAIRNSAGGFLEGC